MKFLKSKHYVDAKNFAGECQAVVVLAKGQSKKSYIWLATSIFRYLLIY